MDVSDVVDFAVVKTSLEVYRLPGAKLLNGDPKQSIYNHYASSCGQMNAGVWEGQVGKWSVSYTEHEYCEILSGISVLSDSSGNNKILNAGDRFVIPAGFEGSWEVIEDCRKVYVMFEVSRTR